LIDQQNQRYKNYGSASVSDDSAIYTF